LFCFAFNCTAGLAEKKENVWKIDIQAGLSEHELTEERLRRPICFRKGFIVRESSPDAAGQLALPHPQCLQPISNNENR
jgi:hypothetical protein